MKTHYVFLAFITWSVLAAPAGGQTTAPIPVETILQAKRFLTWAARPSVSPDGTMLVYVIQDPRRSRTSMLHELAQTGIPYGGTGTDLYLVTLQDGKVTNLTEGKGDNWEGTWSPDGKFLAFLSTRDGEGQMKLWLWERDTKVLRKVSDLPIRASRIRWLRDSRHVLVTTIPEGMTPKQYAERVSHPHLQNADYSKVAGSSVMLYRSSPNALQPVSGFNLDESLLDLVLIDVRSGETRRIDSGHRIHQWLLSPDSSTALILSGKRFAGPASQQILFDVRAVDVASGEERVLLQDAQVGFFGTLISWSPDSSQVAFRIAEGVDGGDYFVLDVKQKPAPRRITQLSKPLKRLHNTSSPVWDASGQNLYFVLGQELWQAPVNRVAPRRVAKIEGGTIVEIVAQNENLLWSPDGNSATVLTRDSDRKKDHIYRIDLKDGTMTSLIDDGRCYTCVTQDPYITVSPDGKMVTYFAGDADHPTDLWTADAAFHEARQLTHINSELENYRLGTTQSVAWRSLDGEQLHGTLLLPAGYQEGKRYPLVVSVYGGARLSDFRISLSANVPGLPINPQLLASRGYALLLPDAPQHPGTPMVDLAKTVLPGVDRVIEMGIADPARLAIIGHSYGGYSALALIVQTTRFKAAAMIDGYGDLISAYGAMDKAGTAYGASVIEEGQGLMQGSPWQYPERYIENSPIFHLDRVETPLLIIHGAADSGVPAFLADEVFVDLRRLGKEVEYAKYQQEDHVPMMWSYSNYLDFCDRLLRWFDDHLKTVSQ